ncbi:MAG TPA: hypothetical protein VM141_09405 [Planctomycetota bacterium]|nr:hypothetical protein [Planctomycetota bacterium]
MKLILKKALRIGISVLLIAAGVASILVGLAGFVLPVIPGIPFFVGGVSLLFATIPAFDRWFKRKCPRIARTFEDVTARIGDSFRGRKSWRRLLPDIVALARTHARLKPPAGPPSAVGS